MYLSDAIREGSKYSRQCFGVFFGPDFSACAVGAVLIGAGLTITKNNEYICTCPFSDYGNISIVTNFYNTISTYAPKCPLCNYSFGISYLNDTHRLSREEIADYVEEVEYRCGIRSREVSVDQPQEPCLVSI